MNIYSIDVKNYNGCNPEYKEHSKFIVLGDTINDMLENLYKELFPNKEDIPYYLRSSNFVIICLGVFIPNKDYNLREKILCKRYENWYE